MVNKLRQALKRRSHRTKYDHMIKPYKVEPITDLKGWAGLTVGDTYLAIRDLLGSASNEILIANYQFRTSEPNKNSFVNTLVGVMRERSERGVSVKILLNKIFPRSYLNTEQFKTCNRLKLCGLDVRLYNEKRILHSKLIIVDRRKVYLGSHNFTNTSMAVNSETGIILNSEEIANYFLCYWENIWRKSGGK